MSGPAFRIAAEWLTALLVVLGAAFAAIGSFGLLRLPDFFRRVHAPTLGATLGVWAVSLGTVVFFAAQGIAYFLHPLLIAIFVALTAPVSTIFVLRAALFRQRQQNGPVPPPLGSAIQPAPPLASASAPAPPASPPATASAAGRGAGAHQP